MATIYFATVNNLTSEDRERGTLTKTTAVTGHVDQTTVHPCVTLGFSSEKRNYRETTQDGTTTNNRTAE